MKLTTSIGRCCSASRVRSAILPGSNCKPSPKGIYDGKSKAEDFIVYIFYSVNGYLYIRELVALVV